jgi:predicted PurR-regulated permease PerM
MRLVERWSAIVLRLIVLGAGVAIAVVVLARLRLVVLPVIVALVLSTFLAPGADRLRREEPHGRDHLVPRAEQRLDR